MGAAIEWKMDSTGTNKSLGSSWRARIEKKVADVLIRRDRRTLSRDKLQYWAKEG